MNCEYCGKPKSKWNKRFCSDTCRQNSDAARSVQALQKKLASRKPCLNCGRPLASLDQLKFCSHSCSAKYNNSRRPRKYAAPQELPANNAPVSVRNLYRCRCCGAKINTTAKYCSRFCQSQLRREISVTTMMVTKTMHEPGQQASRTRNHLIAMFGNRCMTCDREEWQGEPIPLVFDHIDGNSYNPDMSNCRMICPNCDAQTPYYKGKNRGRGRVWRMERRANGQSF
jgi:predicted nucleic acid-binding Zn ribbon protein